MAAITANTFAVIDKCSLINEAYRSHRTTFNACPAGNASIPNYPGPDRKRILRHRFKNSLIPRHGFQTKTAGRYLGTSKIRNFHIRQIDADDFNLFDAVGF